MIKARPKQSALRRRELAFEYVTIEQDRDGPWQERNQMKILIPVEDILFGSLIVNFLAQHDWPEDTSFRVVTVVEPYFLDHGSQVDFSELLSSTDCEILGAATRIVEDVAGSIKDAFPKATVSHEVFEGHITDMIAAHAREWQADLIVAGSHGTTGFNRMFLGSVSLALLSEAPCPVLLVKPDGQTQTAWENINLSTIPVSVVPPMPLARCPCIFNL